MIRCAEVRDIPFLVEAIIAAEKSGTETVSYCQLFGLTECELRDVLAEILVEDVIGQELSVSGFRIAEVGGEAAAAACGWIEAAEEIPSTILKANLLHHFLGAARIEKAKPHFATLASLSFPRQVGALQLESIFVVDRFRGRNLIQDVLLQHLDAARSQHSPKAQIILSGQNQSALKAYQKLGFYVVAEKTVAVAETAGILPANTKLLLEKPLC